MNVLLVYSSRRQETRSCWTRWWRRWRASVSARRGSHPTSPCSTRSTPRTPWKPSALEQDASAHGWISDVCSIVSSDVFRSVCGAACATFPCGFLFYECISMHKGLLRSLQEQWGLITGTFSPVLWEHCGLTNAITGTVKFFFFFWSWMESGLTWCAKSKGSKLWGHWAEAHVMWAERAGPSSQARSGFVTVWAL